MPMWEPFTEHARRSVVLAQEEAQRLGNDAIGPEHMLLGILAQGENRAVRALRTLGFDVATIRQDAEAAAQRRTPRTMHEMEFTPRSKRVIELAFEEARRQSYNYIGTETILLGIVREGDGAGGRVLKNLGVSADTLRTQIVALVKTDEANEP